MSERRKLRSKVTLKSRVFDTVTRLPTSGELKRAQYEAFLRQIPLLYLLLVINTAAVAFTHRGVAPAWLTVYVPGILCSVCGVRVLSWLSYRKDRVSDLLILRRLRRMLVIAGALAAAFSVWALALSNYGNAYERFHVVFYIAITVIGCIFCLMHLRAAAFLVAGVVLLPFVVYLLVFDQPNEVLIAIACNVVLVAGVMIVMLLIHSQDFANLVDSQRRLLAKQKETERLSSENFRLANVDSLTLLPNRRRFYADLEGILSHAPTDNTKLVVGILDLDKFHSINEIYGAGFGDRVLEEVGRRLSQFCSKDVSIARLGGDGFGILIQGDFDNSAIHEFGRSVCGSLRQPYVLADGVARISASLGLSTYSQAGTSASELMERAEYALLFARDRCPGAPVIFAKEHETEIKRLNLIERGLKLGDLEHEVSVHFQPIFDVETKEIVEFEALSRWNSPTLGMVGPGEFFSVAERSDIIHSLTLTLLRKTLAAAAGWPSQVRISFNLSGRDVSSKESVSSIIKTTLASGIDPKRITFEVTETALIQHIDGASERLALLKEMGAEIALDDFGTGYSSLSYVHRLPIDKIKIDRSFIADIGDTPSACVVVRSILDLCSNLEVDCIVVGVENLSQVNALLNLGCTVMQGYFFGKPLPPDDVLEAFVTNGFISHHSQGEFT